MSDSSHTDLDALRRMADSEIDCTDIPEQGEDFMQRAELRIPAKTARCVVQLDPEVVSWFRGQNSERYLDLINAALREHISTHQ